LEQKANFDMFGRREDETSFSICGGMVGSIDQLPTRDQQATTGRVCGAI
jgi:hypothetical protein